MTGNSPISPYPKDIETVIPLCDQNMGTGQESKESESLINLPFYSLFTLNLTKRPIQSAKFPLSVVKLTNSCNLSPIDLPVF